MSRSSRIALYLILSLGIAYLGWKAYVVYVAAPPMGGIASGNGRIEAVEIDIAARTTGRLHTVDVSEGEFVEAGKVVATLDLEQLIAQRREAAAQLSRAKIAVDTAKAIVNQREAERDATAAVVAQSQVQLQVARKRLARSLQLSRSGTVSGQTLDDDQARVDGAAAAFTATNANLEASKASISAANALVVDARAAVEAAEATVARVDADLSDGQLRAPCSGRVQYIIARPGEVVAAGARVLNILDVGDVYMTFFLPAVEAGRTAIGSEARIVLDAAPQYVVPARISFISDVAQFTPKTVETDEEREKLMFRLRAQVPKELLQKYVAQVKTGLPGRAYVKIDPNAPWPESLSKPLLP